MVYLKELFQSEDRTKELSDTLFIRCLALTKNRDDANDIAQTTLLRLIERGDNFDGTNLEGYSYTIAKRIFLDDIKKKRPIPVDNLEDLQNFGPQEGIEIGIDYEICFYKLGDDERDIISIIPKYNYDEMAEILGISNTAVRKRVSRARKSLAECMGIIR